jgi:hypothetical protein
MSSSKGNDMSRRVVWFSCGAASAVAAKMATDAEVVYCDTLSSEHPDNARFMADVERWIGRRITVIRSEKFASVDEVIEKKRYLSGTKGAPCTAALKAKPRIAWQRPGDVHIFGYTAEEGDRADAFGDEHSDLETDWILIRNGITKARCLEILSDAGIQLPAMYGLGFEHNNCLGCVKATGARYWNMIREHFPATFEKRCAQSRLVGARLTRVRGERVFLDELPADYMPVEPPEQIDCGPMCQMPLPGFASPVEGGKPTTKPGESE